MSSDVRAANCSLSNEIRCFLEFKLNHPNLFKVDMQSVTGVGR